LLRKGKEKIRVLIFCYIWFNLMDRKRKEQEKRIKKKLKIEYVDPISCVAFAVDEWECETV
jgi:hypothetical protein